MKISLGLDIGVSSVGFSVLDADTGEILELGSRLFNGSIAAENLTRRDSRGSRRTSNRNKQRRKDVAKLFVKHNLIEQFAENDYFSAFSNNTNPYSIRAKGLTEKLTKLEIAQALYNIVKRRGISYDLQDAEVDDDASVSDYSASLNKNTALLKNYTPAEIQLQRLNEYGAVRGKIVVENSENHEVLLNVFPTKEFVKEAKKIIECQRQFYPDVVTDDFEEKYLTILQRKRDYFVGPGSEKSRSDYGIYKTSGKTLTNLFEELVGKDNFYPDEYRASGASYTAQLFNVLNDLNNLRILSHEDQKLTSEDKKKIIDELNSTTGNPSMIKLIKKVTGCSDSDIKGYRLDSKDKPDIHSMAIYRKIHRDFKKLGIDIHEWKTADKTYQDFLDDISFGMTLNTENGEIRRMLKEDWQPVYPFLDDELIQTIIDNKASFDIKTNNKWHRFSIKLMKELIPEMKIRPIEQMTLIHELGLVDKNKTDYSRNTYVPYKQIAKEIYNPVASKSVREALKIVNAVLKKYSRIDYVVIEMPREKNEEDEKKNIAKFQKENKQRKDAAMKAFVEAVGSQSAVDDALRTSSSWKVRLAIQLWYQQDRVDLYSGRRINATDLISNFSLFEIDHIIPQSISFDDSINNKTLCYKDMNQIKGQKTPFEFMNEGHGQQYDVMKAIVLKNSKFSKAKKSNYLFEENVSDIETRKRFISRNLVDTRYSSRVVLNSLQDFFKGKEFGTKVSVIRGKFTNNMRKHWRLNKTRDTFHHHAIDASIIASTPFLRMWKKGGSIFPRQVNEATIDIETGEILDDKSFNEEMYQLPYSGFVEQLDNAESRVKFSHQVDKKVNRKVSNSTIYSTRMAALAKDKNESEYVLAKIKNIYDADEYARMKKLLEKDKTKFLLYRIDPKTFAMLEEILEMYPDTTEIVGKDGKVKKIKVSPFELYRRDHGMVRKYSKKGNGPVIKQLKYLDSKLGSHIDITPGSASPEKHVVLQSLKPWRTDVYYNNSTNSYEIMGINYSDLKFNRGEGYGIKKDRYFQLMKDEGVSNESDFCFTLYRKDRIKVLNPVTGEVVEMLFWSRNKVSKGYAEIKPIDKAMNENGNYPIYGDAKKQVIKRLVPNECVIHKINVDILGNTYEIEKESDNPKNVLD
ncbi:type II CRISPR RNA-guided endonuclease Cas9 [Companilactobacillus sp.]|jgi:CRISPR-associated endonuclease Csn1|uniref:type II CRISPR RNA-guided endonuclease Cas9 n=1 Tax=Companilactobacillus sp. TaxID=2767905 RepID=UPI0025C40CB9|nr:type II CRISPR RNA-guided endonuclease Cas9 [Companilactobacillus sp.]MCH4010266.1 type II CRISPR RNA-guided endonuclease Cas9 [Companilactobacillus sp.]MCH4052058.1 type II CRISPR RNA-guided endonuclease Cas9 [Companilactobacillus sp.]MCH4078208.1 type II CRISPR RNA-guided endonuclease Cas9 [Companilactobacillus sp.]MCH4126784.1 type II CRISPR RNA-guided endonuclease Cas9 [Companilactobacillus sp.]MCH4132369.1 type II CRISPR RNA-guided endonuclease Cas9 [Companilactobacillus sp.]